MIFQEPLVKTMTTIELDDQDVELFKQYRRYQDKFKLLILSGFFDLKGASGTVHFDSEGHIRKIENLQVKLYS